MKKDNFLEDWFKKIDVDLLWQKLDLLVVQPYVELYDTIFYRRGSLLKCMVVSSVIQLAILFYLDWYFFKLIGMKYYYPVKPIFRWPYLFFMVMASFYFWGAWQVVLRTKITRWLTDVFTNANIKSASGKLPSFIFDKAIDKETRLLRLKKNGTLKTQYDPSDRPKMLDQLLQVEIDRIEDNIPNGTIDIYYSHASLEKFCEFKGVDYLGADQFYIGKSRTGTEIADLKKAPHYLIGGTTGSGKSYFFNQMIASMYLRNPDFTFELIDLKFGAEFQSKFKKLPRVNIHDTTAEATRILGLIAETELEERAELLKANECDNIEALQAIPDKDLKLSENSSFTKKFSRKIIVIDEAHELFLKTDKNKAEEAIKARNFTNRIAALGRSVGVHIFVGTQRPDSKAVDPLIKANLPSRICFYASNLATSMTILDNGRGAQLSPDIKGRCIWQNGGDAKEIQAFYLAPDKLKDLMEPHKKKEKEVEKSNSTEQKTAAEKLDSYEQPTSEEKQ